MRRPGITTVSERCRKIEECYDLAARTDRIRTEVSFIGAFGDLRSNSPPDSVIIV